MKPIYQKVPRYVKNDIIKMYRQPLINAESFFCNTFKTWCKGNFFLYAYLQESKCLKEEQTGFFISYFFKHFCKVV